MQMEAGLDTGPMLLKGETPVARKTAGELTQEIAELGARLMVQVLGDLAVYPPVVQPDEGVTYAAKIDKAEARLDVSQSAAQVERQVRAFNPMPGAFFELKGERLRVHAADIVATTAQPGTILDDQLTIACAEGAIRPTIIQRAGRPAMPTEDFLRGFVVAPGTVIA